jgi:hypothetical protein
MTEEERRQETKGPEFYRAGEQSERIVPAPKNSFDGLRI